MTGSSKVCSVSLKHTQCENTMKERENNDTKVKQLMCRIISRRTEESKECKQMVVTEQGSHSNRCRYHSLHVCLRKHNENASVLE